MESNREHGLPSFRSYTLGEEDASGPAEGSYRNALASEKKDKTLTDAVESDGASILANSTFSGYTPSSIETKGLLPNGRRSESHRHHRTAGRSAFVGVCRAVNVVAPVDLNEDVTSMHGSSLAKLARTVMRKEAYPEVKAARSGSI